MTSSPPDFSSLSLSSHQRLNDSYDYEVSSSPRPQYHFATSTGIPIHSQYNALNSGQSPLKNKGARAGLPTQWMDNSPDNRSLSPHNNSDFSSAGGSSPPTSHLSPPPIPPTAQNTDDEIIPTAIVIKNIPFNVKRETLLDLIASLSIPTPYAFNYHLDQAGQFRGLAFANFRQAADADAVVAALNGFDVQGRKLRVEYKKVLQASEKERIEREKAIRRMRSMQLEKEQSGGTPTYEEYTPQTLSSLGSAVFTPQRSFSSSSYQHQYSPPELSSMPSYGQSLSSAPVMSSQVPSSAASSSDKVSANELDLNDPITLDIYSRILLFKDDRMRDELAFSRNLTPKQRRIVHLLAKKMDLYHYSVGEGDDRYAVVTRVDPNRQQQQQTQRPPHTLSRAPSAYLMSSAVPQAPPNALRVKKSMPDLKTLHSQVPRLTSRSSNGNIREGFTTLSSPSRRVSIPLGGIFSNGGTYGSSVPPVPSLPSALSSGTLNGGGSGHDSPGGVVRQPRGPGTGGFGRRDSRVGASEGQPRVRSDSLQGDDGRCE